MAKKQTFAAVMKQLSNKKGSYEKGLEEARRVGNPSGIRDYERRLAKLSAGMDELFQTQQMMNGGNTNMPKAENGMSTERGPSNMPMPGSPKIMTTNKIGLFKGQSLVPWDGRDNAVVNEDGYMVVGTGEDGTRFVHTPQSWYNKANNPEVYFKFLKNTGAGGFKQFQFDPETYEAGSFDNNGAYLKPGEAKKMDEFGRPLQQAGAVEADAAGDPIPVSTGGIGQLAFMDAMNEQITGGVQPAAASPEPTTAVTTPAAPATPTASVTAPTTSSGTNATAPGTAALDAEQARRRAEAANLGMAGASATSGIDPSVFGQGTQLPGLNTQAQMGALPGVFGIAEQMGAFNAPTKTTVENAAGTDVVTDADKTSSTAAQNALAKAGKALGSIGLGGKGLGMALGAAAQFLPDLRSMKAMGDIEGPAMMPTRNPLTMNTDIQTGRAIQDIRNQTALSNAAVDANIANPAVAAAAKRANQRVEQGQLGNVLFNEAQKENELRNQNLRQLQETQYGNQMTNYQNRMNQINFENERIAAENRMRGQMSQKLGAAFGDFQNRAQDMKKWDLVRKLDQYGVIGRNNIDPTS